jgi:hypothetical protein
MTTEHFFLLLMVLLYCIPAFAAFISELRRRLGWETPPRYLSMPAEDSIDLRGDMPYWQFGNVTSMQLDDRYLCITFTNGTEWKAGNKIRLHDGHTFQRDNHNKIKHFMS